MDIVIPFILNCLLIFFIGLFGNIIRWAVPVKKIVYGRFQSIFIDLLIGLVCVILLFSTIKTSLRTINLLFLFFIVISIIQNFRNYQDYSVKSFISSIYIYMRSFLIFIPIILVFYSYEAVFYFKSGIFNEAIPYCDFTYYSDISAMMNLSGEENKFLLSNLYSNDYHGATPYHYFELWLNSIFYSFLPYSYIKSLMIGVYPFLYSVSFIGVISIWEKFSSVSFKSIIISLFLLFIGGIYLKFYDDFELLRYWHGNISSILYVWGKKYAVCYPFIIASFLLMTENNYRSGFYVLLSLGIVSVGLMPGIIGGLLLFFISNFIHRSLGKFENRGLLIITVVFVFLFVGFYLLFGNRGMDAFGSESISNNIYEVFSIDNTKTIIFKIVFPVVRIIIMYSPFIILALYVFIKSVRQKSMYHRFFKVIILIFVFSIISGALSAGISINLLSGSQFLTYLLPIFIVLFMFFFIYELRNIVFPFSKNISQLIFLGALLILLIYNMSNIIKMNIENRNYTMQNPGYSEQYLEDLTSFLNKNDIKNKMGVAFIGEGDQNIYPLSYMGVLGLTFAGISLKAADHHYATTNLGIFDVKVDTLEQYKRDFFKTFEFYKFFTLNKANFGDSLNLDELKIKFIKENKIEYALIYKNAIIPKPIERNIDIKIEDKNTGESLICFDPSQL